MYLQFLDKLVETINSNKENLQLLTDKREYVGELYKWYEDIYTSKSFYVVTVKRLQNDIYKLLGLAYEYESLREIVEPLLQYNLDYTESHLEECFYAIYIISGTMYKEVEVLENEIKEIINKEIKNCYRGLNNKIVNEDIEIEEELLTPEEVETPDKTDKPETDDIERPSVDDIINNKPENLPPTTDEDKDNLPSEPDENNPTEEPDVDTNEPTTESDKETDESIVNPDIDGSKLSEDTPE